MNNTEDNNRLIVEFMGAVLGNGTEIYPIVYNNVPDFYSTRGSTSTCPLSSLQYHKRWDWLMPVVEKIKSQDFFKTISGEGSAYVFDLFIDEALVTAKIENVYKAVLKFINWYNSLSN